MRRESAYLRDALQAVAELEEFVAQTSRERFLEDRLQQSFVFHRLIILGEAAAALQRNGGGGGPAKSSSCRP